MPLNFNQGFIRENIVQSHFPILKAPSSTPKYNIVDRSSLLRMLDDCSPQNIWYFDFCGEFSSSVLYPGSILLQKITCNSRFFVNDQEFLKELSAGNLCGKISMLSKNSSNTCRLWIKTYFFLSVCCRGYNDLIGTSH